ncbi:MAG: hypothetical protein KGM95_06995 [Betaproteobacteria bacterium]|nr:hypothetical protein [Betaproteobacteria bacterium]
MKSFSISNLNVRSLVPVLGLAGTLIFSVSGIAYAQYGGNGSSQGSSVKEKPASTGTSGATKPSAKGAKEKYYGMPKEGEEMDTGYVDQKKRMERAQDARSPSPDPHVSDFPKDKEGRPMKDLKDEQGGSIGPN